MSDKENPGEGATSPAVNQKDKGKGLKQSSSKRPAEKASEPVLVKRPQTMPNKKPKTLPSPKPKVPATPKSSASAAAVQSSSNIIPGTNEATQSGSHIIPGTVDAAKIAATYELELAGADQGGEPSEETEPRARDEQQEEVPVEESIQTGEATAPADQAMTAVVQNTATTAEITQTAEPTPNPIAAPSASTDLSRDQGAELPQAEEVDFIKPAANIRPTEESEPILTDLQVSLVDKSKPESSSQRNITFSSADDEAKINQLLLCVEVCITLGALLNTFNT